jgi:hypothetical protein
MYYWLQVGLMVFGRQDFVVAVLPLNTLGKVEERVVVFLPQLKL